jgi:Arc/MetJ-type ribon-helix-helix transcriptional regulator
MTAAKIAITLAPEHLTRARAAVRAGRAASVSGYIARAIERQAQEESLEALVRELIAEHGEPSSKDKAWARRVLKHRKRP